MLNFNKLRIVVFEIFDNSQLFLTDPRIFSLLNHVLRMRRLSSIGRILDVLYRDSWFELDVRHFFFLQTMYVCRRTSLQVETHN